MIWKWVGWYRKGFRPVVNKSVGGYRKGIWQNRKVLGGIEKGLDSIEKGLDSIYKGGWYSKGIG